MDGEGMVDPAVLDIEDKDIRTCFKEALSNVAAVHLQIGYSNAPAVPHMVIRAFRNLVAFTLDTDITFKEVLSIFWLFVSVSVTHTVVNVPGNDSLSTFCSLST